MSLHLSQFVVVRRDTGYAYAGPYVCRAPATATVNRCAKHHERRAKMGALPWMPHPNDLRIEERKYALVETVEHPVKKKGS
ncbi:hypothetical protein CFB82_19945 [Burkholderia sp. HI2714]|uniref:hypothetical protein n=1 Tax=Burkholderia sp. HI2714 TaxID=2015359 RepID=UPI000B79C252|nr:hypothetical protein [Burkholderia sp. HI2714]OXJ32660.1 hypothetical protein CFB82_19945 [Burkholderia sp. HI2714]